MLKNAKPIWKIVSYDYYAEKERKYPVLTTRDLPWDLLDQEETDGWRSLFAHNVENGYKTIKIDGQYLFRRKTNG